MLLLRLWNYIRGYVIILIDGYFLEKFMNICTRRQIFLWDVKRLNDNQVTLKISINGFKLLRPVAKKTGCRVRIVRKKGLPFTFNKYKRRKTFLAGAILFILLVYFMTSFIWDVEITGNKKIPAETIAQQLADLGIRPGVLKYGINTEKALNELILGNQELTWAGMEIKGTKVKVQIVERKKPPELVPKDKPCDIIATRDGIIKTVIANDGNELVKEGDSVVKGQVLISGKIPNVNDPKKFRIVHAMGSVKARTWYEGLSPVTTKSFERIKTGKYLDGYALVFFGSKLHIYSGGARFLDYDKIEIKKQLSLGQDMILPFGIIINRTYEVANTERVVDEETAKQEAAEEALRIAKENIPENTEIVTTSLEFLQGENGLTAKVVIECLEEIGSSVGIGGE